MNYRTKRAARTDLYALLREHTTDTIEAVQLAVRGGRINGHSYYTECCCIIGHLAQITGRTLDAIKGGGDVPHPIETFICQVWPGQTPADDEALEAVDEWLTDILDERRRQERARFRQQLIENVRATDWHAIIEERAAEEVLA